MKEFTKDTLKVKILENRTAMGECAARDIHDCIQALLAKKDEINMIFAAAPSQSDALAALVKYTDIEWNRINAYHMDEYIGLADEFIDQRFAKYLEDHIFGLVPFKSVNLINCSAENYEEECERYSALLKANPTDIVVMGIGENGHIAFNDPWIADFNDKQVVKIVPLDEVCRQQQVNDGCFPAVENVPTHAMSLTCPTLVSAPNLFCIVPAATKANAVFATINDEISEKCPATILRRQKNATLYLDPDSASLID